MIVFEEVQVPVTGGIFNDSKEPQVMPQMTALLSYRSEQGARAMRDMWDGGAIRPNHVRSCYPWLLFGCGGGGGCGGGSGFVLDSRWGI